MDRQTTREHVICVPYFSRKDDGGYYETPQYKRIVLKLSGEALAGEQGFGFHLKLLNRLLNK